MIVKEMPLTCSIIGKKLVVYSDSWDGRPNISLCSHIFHRCSVHVVFEIHRMPWHALLQGFESACLVLFSNLQSTRGVLHRWRECLVRASQVQSLESLRPSSSTFLVMLVIVQKSLLRKRTSLHYIIFNYVFLEMCGSQIGAVYSILEHTRVVYAVYWRW